MAAEDAELELRQYDNQTEHNERRRCRKSASAEDRKPAAVQQGQGEGSQCPRTNPHSPR
jgi:hypothetical protein